MEPATKKTVIAIAGYAGAGKDTLAKATTWHLAKLDLTQVITVKFADELKDALNVALVAVGLPAEAFTEDRAQKRKMRPLMKEFGVYARGEDINIFAKCVSGIIKKQSQRYEVFFVTDLRYINEYEVLRDLCESNNWNLYPFYVKTDGIGAANPEEQNSIEILLKQAPIITQAEFKPGDMGAFDNYGRLIAEHILKTR
jgi:hypothetical protein